MTKKKETASSSPAGAVLRRLRLDAGLSQGKLVKEAGEICTPAYISSLERGADLNKKGKPTRPDVDILTALAAPLGVPASYLLALFGYAAEADNPTDELSVLMQAIWAEMPPDTRADILVITQALWRKRRHMVVLPDGTVKYLKPGKG